MPSHYLNIVGILSIGPPGRKFGEIRIEIQNLSYMKMHLKMLSCQFAAILSRGGGGVIWSSSLVTGRPLTHHLLLILIYMSHTSNSSGYFVITCYITRGSFRYATENDNVSHPDSKVHGANMGSTWSRQDPRVPHVGHTNLSILVCSIAIPLTRISRAHFMQISVTKTRKWQNHTLGGVEVLH